VAVRLHAKNGSAPIPMRSAAMTA